MGLIRITRFAGRNDSLATDGREVSWEHFCHYLKQRVICKDKWGENNTNPLFSPIEYHSNLEGFVWKRDIIKTRNKSQAIVGKIWENDGGIVRFTNLEGKILRKNENVKSVYMAVFDYDSHPADGKKPQFLVDPLEIIKQLANFNYAVVSTHSNTKEFPRFRAIIPFENPLTVEEFKRAWPFGFEGIDESCKDPARMFLMPTAPPEHEAEAFAYFETDKPFFQPKIPATAEKKKKPKNLRGDYNTMDGYKWFLDHGANPRAAATDKWFVDCPWATEHTGAVQGETDSVLWTEPQKWPTFKCSHNSCAARDINTVMALWGDQDKYCTEFLTPAQAKSDVEVKALGHDDMGRYFYQCNVTNHIVALKANEHRELNFYSITANPHYWYSRYFEEESGKLDWKKAARDMMTRCHQRGFFKPQALRGAGIWRDDGRLVVHLGKHLMVDGVKTSIFEFKSEFVYEAMVKEVELPEALPATDMVQIGNLFARLPFANPGHSVLLAGMVICGYLSGILKWRPHAWIIGNPHGGKSSILRWALAPLWVPMGGVYVEGVTTEAGLRQVEIRHNAVPIIIDESESNDRREIDRVSALVRLARASSTDSTANVVKGNQAATGHSYTVRSCFVFCSIVENLEHDQDKERFSVFEVVESDDSKKNWAKLRSDLERTFTKDFSLRLYARVIADVETILASSDAFHSAIMANQTGATARWADQMGALLAGAWTLLGRSAIPTPEQAWTFYNAIHGGAQLEEKPESNIPRKALYALLAHIPAGQSMSLGERVNLARPINGFIQPDLEQQAFLIRYGLKVHGQELMISSNHPQTEKIFREAGFPGHYNLLARMEGASKSTTTRFGHHTGRAVSIPLPSKDNEHVTNGTDLSESGNGAGTGAGNDFLTGIAF